MVVSGTFTAAGQVSDAVDTSAGASIVLSGSYTGRVTAEISCDGAGARYAPAGTMEQVSAMTVTVAGQCKIRLRCAQLSTGAIAYDLAAA
mgnify:CR=1 FL=1